MRKWIRPAFLLLVFLFPLSAGAQSYLIPVGRVVGLRLKDSNVTVAAYDDTMGTHAGNCALKIGDVLLSVNDHEIRCAEDVRDALESAPGSARIKLRRGNRTTQVTLTPADTPDGPKLGVYLRQGIAGIGTVTWFDPATRKFGALGHGVNDSAGNLLQMAQGSAYFAEILSVTRGKSGQPGQLKGSSEAERECGQLIGNTPQGVFGINPAGWAGNTVPTAEPEEIHTGSASILSTVDGNIPREYSVEILKLYSAQRPDGRNLLLKITDPALLEATGGIVQGMSGSPILQDGKLVGAVTHVLVNDPALGYGIFIDNMLVACGDAGEIGG